MLGAVCGEGIEDDDVVGEADRFEEAWEVVLFVEGLDEDGDAHGVGASFVFCVLEASG